MRTSRTSSTRMNARQERLFKVLGQSSGGSTNANITQYVNRVLADGGTIEGVACMYNYILRFENL
jgi:hypothetical protein